MAGRAPAKPRLPLSGSASEVPAAGIPGRAVDVAERVFRQGDRRHERRLRSRVPNAMADRVEEHHDALVELPALDNGETRSEAAPEVGVVPSELRWWAAMALTEQGRAAALPGGRTSIVVRTACPRASSTR